MKSFVIILLASVSFLYANSLFYQASLGASSDYRDALSRYSSGHLQVMEAKFYPIGWSRSGKFAYAIEKPNEAADCQPAGFYIQNMVTDKMVTKIEGCFNTPNLNHPDIRHYMADRVGQIRHLLRKYGIRVKHPSIRQFPVGSEQRGYGANLYAHYSTSPRYYGQHEKFLRSFRLKLHKKRNYNIIRSKTISTQHFKASSGYYDAVIAGYIPSPFEKRIAVVLAYFVRGWEGPPNLTAIRLVGGSLVKGL